MFIRKYIFLKERIWRGFCNNKGKSLAAIGLLLNVSGALSRGAAQKEFLLTAGTGFIAWALIIAIYEAIRNK